jgi:imidazolonepropionase
LATLVRAKTIVPCTGEAAQRGVTFDALGRIDDAAMLIDEEHIVAMGPRKEVERGLHGSIEELDLRDNVIVPGFVDAHAHPLFAGDREPDFSSRLRGEKPALGMLYTVERTREALLDVQRFFDHILGPRLAAILKHGTTTLETKTGYALHKPGEDTLLDIIAEHRDDLFAPTLVATFLGAHALPPEFTREEAYIDDSDGSGARSGVCRCILRARILLAATDAALFRGVCCGGYAVTLSLRRDGLWRGRGDGGAGRRRCRRSL